MPGIIARFFWLNTCFLFTTVLYSQVNDTAYLKEFKKPNTIEVYSGIDRSMFDFVDKDLKTTHSLLANSGNYVGVFANYKWFAIGYAFSIPKTFIRNDVKFKYHQYSFGYSRNNITFRPFYTSYQGLLLHNSSRQRHERHQPLKEIHYKAAGIHITYFLNRRTFSYSAANYFSKKQLKSSGSFFVTAKPYWESLKWNGLMTDSLKRSGFSKFITTNPSWISLLAGIGYQHTFSLAQGKWLISPLMGLSAGALKLNSDNKLKAAMEMNTGITAGYSGENFYGYLNGVFKYSKSQLPILSLNKINTDVSFTFGYRFRNLPRKIAGLL